MTNTASNPVRIQLRVIHALLLREVITRYGRHNIGFLWLFVEPMLFTLGITLIWTATKQTHGSTIPIVAFAVSGYSTVLLWRNMPARCIGALQTNAALMFHRNVKPLDVYLSRLILEIAGATASFVVLSLACIGLELMQPPEDLLTVMFGWFLIAWFGAALAMFIGALSERSEIVDRFWHPIAYFILPASGVFILVDAMPEAAQRLILALPMAHATEMIRDGYFGSQFRAHYSPAYLIAWCVGLSALGLAETRRVHQRISTG